MSAAPKIIEQPPAPYTLTVTLDLWAWSLEEATALTAQLVQKIGALNTRAPSGGVLVHHRFVESALRRGEA